MPRAPRIHFYGAVYHVMARGVDGREIFADDNDRLLFLAELERAKRDYAADIKAYVLMGNHFHLAIRVERMPLSVIMQRVESVYAQAFNRRHCRAGHLFQSRYKAKLCLDETYLRTVIRYIHLNPVRAGLTHEAHHWPWSSLHGAPIDADGPDLTSFEPWKGAEELELDLKRELFPPQIALSDIGTEVASRAAITSEQLKSSTFDRRLIAAKREFARQALQAGYPLTRIAEWLGCPMGSASRYARQN